MQRIRPLLTLSAAAAIVTIPAASAGAADEFGDACRRFVSAPVVFIGRVTSPPVRRHVPSQDQIDRMRRQWSEADAEIGKRKIWPVPIDVVVTPMRVETALRNSETTDVSVRTQRPDELKVGQSYLVYGQRDIDAIFPDIVTATNLVAQPDTNGEEVRSLATTRAFGGAVFGSLMFHDGVAEAPLPGVLIRFRAGDQQIEAITTAGGRFIAGVPAGDISVGLLLPSSLSVDAPAPHVISIPDGGCSELHLRAKRRR